MSIAQLKPGGGFVEQCRKKVEWFYMGEISEDTEFKPNRKDNVFKLVAITGLVRLLANVPNNQF